MSKPPYINLNDGEYTRFYYQGIDPRIVRNPCQFKIAGDLTFDDHLVRITRLPDADVKQDGNLYVDSLFVYDNNNFKPLFTYRTGDAVASGTVIDLNLVDTAKDQRNETIVVGRRIGTETAGVSDKVINPNNPTFKHINSRALDMGSIINSGTTNFMGRPLQTIQIAPEISSQKRADHWASVFVTRYRKPERSPNYQALMNPLLEVGDCIAVSDESRGIVNTYDNLWIESINTKVTPTSAIDSMETTSYEPWASFSPRPQVTSLDNFGGLAISNLTLLQSNEQKATASDDPYDPYTSQESNNRIEITYDLNVDADVRIDIVHQTGILVATLLNPTGEEESKGWSRQTIGKNYKVDWDGVDMFGDWNKNTPVVKTDTTSSKTMSGFYVAELYSGAYERFFVRFRIDETVSNKLHIVTSRNDFAGDNQWIYTQRGDPVTIETNFSPPYLSDVDPSPISAPGVQLGFFSDSNTIGGQNAGLKIGVKNTNALRRPSQLAIDIEMICFGVTHVTLSFLGDDLSPFKHPFSIRTPINAINFTDFKDRSEEYNIYFDPVRWGYVFKNIDVSLHVDEAVTMLGNITPSSSWEIKLQDPQYVAWYVKFTVKLIDLSGRAATSTIYHRWDGPQRSGVFDTTSVVGDDNYLKYTEFGQVWTGQGFRLTTPGGVTSILELFVKSGLPSKTDRDGFGDEDLGHSGYGLFFNALT